ncbi:uncharacterized protein [Amphiura filiformis]|uniref:uncharacterized protein n=1 Tax=Amphiura filiformis TaxID=82378 RepID=UPI003B21CB2E
MEGQTALHLASRLRHDKVCEILLKAGADVDAKVTEGQKTALHLASISGRDKVCEILLKAGADVHAKDMEGQTALHLASRLRHDKVCEILLKAGADVDAKVTEGQKTALHLASISGRDKVCEILLKAGADVHAKDMEGQTALHLASRLRHDKVCEILLKAGADVDAKDTEGQTALHLARISGRDKVCEILLKAGADVHAKDKEGQTAHHLASVSGHDNVCELLKAGADVHAKDKEANLMDAQSEEMQSLASRLDKSKLDESQGNIEEKLKTSVNMDEGAKKGPEMGIKEDKEMKLVQGVHFKVSHEEDTVEPEWRLASFIDVETHSDEVQQLLSSNKLLEIECRMAHMSSITGKSSKYELKSENMQKLDRQLLTNVELPVDHELSKELASLLTADPETNLSHNEQEMSTMQLATTLLSEIRKWIPLRNDTIGILKGIASNLEDLSDKEDIDRAMGGSVTVAQGLALIGTSLLSILTGGAAGKYCSVVASITNVTIAKQLKEYLTKYHCTLVDLQLAETDLQSAVSVISSDVQVSMRIQQLILLLLDRCKERKERPECALATGVLQYKEVFELINDDQLILGEDPIECARALLDILQNSSPVKGYSCVGLALDIKGLVDIACTLAVGSPDASSQILLKKAEKMMGSVSNICVKLGTLKNAFERKEFQEDLKTLFDWFINVPVSDCERSDKRLLNVIRMLNSNLPNQLSREENQVFEDLMHRFLPLLTEHTNLVRHMKTGKIEIVLIAHANIGDSLEQVGMYLPVERDDEMRFYQPWGMKMSLQGAVAIATGHLKKPGDRVVLRKIPNGEPEKYKCADGTASRRFNVLHRINDAEVQIPKIQIEPFSLQDEEYRPMVELLQRMEEADTINDKHVFLWAMERGAYGIPLFYITQVFQLYALSHSVKLIFHHAACLSDDPPVGQAVREVCSDQYFYSPKVGVDYDFMTYLFG